MSTLILYILYLSSTVYVFIYNQDGHLRRHCQLILFLVLIIKKDAFPREIFITELQYSDTLLDLGLCAWQSVFSILS